MEGSNVHFLWGSWASGTKLKGHSEHSCWFLAQKFFLLGSPDLLISKKMLIISTNVDEIDSVLQNKKPKASQAMFKSRLKGWWSMTGKSSKAGSWFGIHFHCCIGLKLRVEDDAYLSSVTLSPLISLPFLCLCRGRSLTLGRFSSATPPFSWDVSGYKGLTCSLCCLTPPH